MELTKICEKIIDDANAQAAGIIEEANRKSIELINSASENSLKKAQQIKDSAPTLAKEVYDKLISDASIMAKKEILSEKRALLDDIFKKALSNLENLSLDEYKALISQKAKPLSEKTLIEVEKKFSSQITDEFLKSVNPLLKKSENFAVSGFNFVMESSRLNYNFSETISRIMEEKDSDVALILFS